MKQQLQRSRFAQRSLTTSSIFAMLIAILLLTALTTVWPASAAHIASVHIKSMSFGIRESNALLQPSHYTGHHS